MTTYPFNENRQQVNPSRCPAPWCGCDLTRNRGWWTPITFGDDLRVSEEP